MKFSIFFYHFGVSYHKFKDTISLKSKGSYCYGSIMNKSLMKVIFCVALICALSLEQTILVKSGTDTVITAPSGARTLV